MHLLLPKERGGGHGRGTVMNVNQFQAFCPAPEFGGGGNDSMGLYDKKRLGRRRRSLHLLGWVIDVHMLLLRQERAGEGAGAGAWAGTVAGKNNSNPCKQDATIVNRKQEPSRVDVVAKK